MLDPGLLVGSTDDGVGMLAISLVTAPHIGSASTLAHPTPPGPTPAVATATVVRPSTVQRTFDDIGRVAPIDVERSAITEPTPPVVVPPETQVVAPAEAYEEPEPPTAAVNATVPSGAEAVVTIASIGIDLPVVLGGQSVIDQGVVAHYTAPGWEPPVPAGAPGTYWLAAHATTHGSPFGTLPDIAVGTEVHVNTGSQTFVYTVTSKQVTGLWPGDDVMYGTDPTVPVILLQTCVDGVRRLLVHGTLTATI